MLLSSNLLNGQSVYQGFETNSCSPADAFYTGCFSDWFCVSGSPDVISNYGAPYAGSRYAHMYSSYSGFNCMSSPNRGESMAINYNFQAGKTYKIKYALRWREGGYCTSLETKFILTNNRNNQTGGNNGCSAGEILPPITSNDEVIVTHSMVGHQSNWKTYSQTFTPTSNCNQLWIRPETKRHPNCAITTQRTNHLYLDAFEIHDCSVSNLTTNFSIWATADQSGNVTVHTSADPNSVPVYHWWDIFYAPNGSTNSDSQVPGNPVQCCNSSTSSFSNNLHVNKWYYIKHGVWNECNQWTEVRKRFRINIQISEGNFGKPTYQIDVEDVDFEHSDEYFSSMNEMVSKFSPEEIKLRNQSEFKFNSEPQVNSISNYPSPFSTKTVIEFDLKKEQTVSLYVYDITGRLVSVLLENETKLAGKNQVVFDGSNMREGIYLYTLKSGDFKETKKMILKK